MTGYLDLGVFVSAFAFWAAVGMLAASGLLALSRVRQSRGAASQPATGGGAALFIGLVGALFVSAVPLIMTATSDGINGVTGDDVAGARPSLMGYAATLSPEWKWIAGMAVAVWAVAVVATIASALSRLASKAD